MSAAFDPGGTARQLASLAGDADSGGEVPFPRALATRLERTELGAASLSLAWELVRLSGERAEASAAILVVLLVLDASRLGSTALHLGDRGRILARGEMLSLDPKEVALLARGLELLERGELLGSLIKAGALAELPANGSARRARTESGPRSEPLITTRSAGASTGPDDRCAADSRLDRRPLVRTGQQLALARHVALEERLASILAGRARRPALAPLAPAAEQTLPPLASIHGPVALTDEQRAAVRAAIAGRQVVIAGGPGTGKTSIVAAIVRALAGGASPTVSPASVALAAPTGKAADRLYAALSLTLANERSDGGRSLLDALAPATTLHRLLGYRAHDDTFTFHAGNPLPHRLVVVDEASMLDLALAERLVSALGPDARLVLLGDPDQLPSVDAGAVLSDLVLAATDSEPPPGAPAAVVPVVRLTRSHRMDASDVSGAHILAVAARIRTGAFAEPTANDRRARTEDGAGASRTLPDAEAAAAHASGVGVYSPDDGGLERFLRAYFVRVAGPILAEAAVPLDLAIEADRARIARLFAALGRTRLLTVTRGAARATGADAVNTILARELHGSYASTAFAPGEPLLAVRNDYDRELMNGDQGLVVRLASGELAGVFLRAGRIVTHPLESIRGTVERAYATTVHKAQGSEHDHVVLLLPEEDMPLIAGRELIYTAVTRARTSALIVGDPGVLARAVKRASHRVTGLRNALDRALPSNGQAQAND